MMEEWNGLECWNEGIMEDGKTGMVDLHYAIQASIIPTFQYSNIPAFPRSSIP